MKPLVALLIALASFQSLSAADFSTDTIPTITFQVLNAETKEPISMAHAINVSRGKGTITDMLGYFQIPITSGDSLKVTAIGYFEMVSPQWGPFSTDTLFYTIHLNPRIYELEGVRFSRFSSYQRFLKEFAALKLAKDKNAETENLVAKYFAKTIRDMAMMNLPSGTSGISFGKDWYARQKEKLEEQLEKERKADVIRKKFNEVIVNELTGLTGISANIFMAYCDFSETFLYESNDYSIRIRIVEKWEAYKQEKVNTKPDFSPIVKPKKKKKDIKVEVSVQQGVAKY
ncbi:MAG: hypothetical protein JW783_05485 [Bacteroidales bacterium]|nr:hypothetical protein [Bacteroidales bacterium]MBN2748110.1 hypothetical protein [Bacteroidales bacterium]